MAEATAYSYDEDVGFSSATLNPSTTTSPVTDALFTLAAPILTHITDYPTLISLSMTCTTFHTQIHNSRKLHAAFLRLELEFPLHLTFTSNCSPQNLPFTGYLDWDIHRPCTPFFLPNDNYAIRNWRPSIDTLPNGHWECNYDFLRHNIGQLPMLEWLPCYGCMRIRRRATHFYHDRTVRHLALFCCRALTRLCVECDVGGAERFKNPLRYLQDMPRGFAGSRLRCAQCRTVEWVVKRPGPKQERRRLCGRCFGVWLAQRWPEREFGEVWNGLVGLEGAAGRVKMVKDRKDVEAVDVGEICASVDVLRYESWCRFEVLELDAG